jgi:ATP-dependent Clp protease ATP-binding subunit ClpB
LSQCIIIMTSNLGASEMTSLVDGRFGFAPKAVKVDQSLDDKVQRTAVEAAQRKFTPEFMNRIDKMVVFRTLRDENVAQILDIEPGMVQQRVLMAAGTNQFVFNCTAAVKEYLLKEDTDPRYGARSLEAGNRAEPGVSAGQPGGDRTDEAGDFVRVDMASENKMIFVKEAENTMAPVLLERYGAAATGQPNLRAARTAVNNRRDFEAGPSMTESK